MMLVRVGSLLLRNSASARQALVLSVGKVRMKVGKVGVSVHSRDIDQRYLGSRLVQRNASEACFERDDARRFGLTSEQNQHKWISRGSSQEHLVQSRAEWHCYVLHLSFYWSIVCTCIGYSILRWSSMKTTQKDDILW